MLNMILAFSKKFILKYLGAVAIEKIVIVLLGELVKRTDSDVDDKIYEIVFKQTNKEVVDDSFSDRAQHKE